MPSGALIHCQVLVRVSTDQRYLVMNYESSEYVTNPEHAFNSFLISPDDKLKDVKHTILTLHPKTIARKKTVAKLRGRDETKALWQETRIPLPFICRHTFADQKDDPLFYGKQFVQYNDGSVWLHAELVADVGDSYKADKEAPQVRVASTPPPAANTSIPTQINTPATSGTTTPAGTNAPPPKSATGPGEMDEDSVAVESVTPKKTTVADDEYSDLSATMQAVVEEEKKMQAQARAFGEQVLYDAEQKKADAEQTKASPAAGQAQVLDGEYQGAAYRAKSIKSAKRTAANHDDDEDL